MVNYFTMNKMASSEQHVAPWNNYHEKLLKRWSQICKTYAIMHSLSAQHYSKWHKRLGIPVVILGGITASSIFSSNSDDSKIWVYINGSLSLLMTGLAGVSSFLGTSEKTNKHQIASFKYTKISMDIDTVLSFSKEYREVSAHEFVSKKNAEMMEIRENAPEVLAWILNHYLKKFDKSLVNIKSSINNNNTSRNVLEKLPSRKNSFARNLPSGMIDEPDQPVMFLSSTTDESSVSQQIDKSPNVTNTPLKKLRDLVSKSKLDKVENPKTDDNTMYNASLQLNLGNLSDSDS